MDYEALNIGEAIRKKRNDMKISLDTAAHLTGVSKAMLGQIERGESNPTVLVLWKISTGLKVPFSSFLSGANRGQSIIDIKSIEPVVEEDGEMLVYNVFPFEPISGFDYLHIQMNPHCTHESLPHNNVAHEYLVVTKGSLLMNIEGQEYLIHEGSAFSFKGALNHTYINPTDEITLFNNVIRYE